MSAKIPPMLVLSVREEGDAQQFITLLQPRLRLGREETNDIVLPDTLASRYHAEMVPEDSGWVVIDLNSTNGVMVNDRRITKRQLLRDGDQVIIGRMQFQFMAGASDESKLAQMLRPIPLFAELPEAVLSGLTAGIGLRYWPRGVLVPASQLEDYLYLVLYGKVATIRLDAAATTTMSVYGVGRFFDGIRAVQSKSIKRVEALENTWLLLIDRPRLDELVVPFLRVLLHEDLSAEQFQALARTMFIESHARGSRLFRQGQYADALYIVVYGEVAMVKHTEEQGEIIRDEIRAYHRQSLFGELGVLVEQPRAATAEVRQESALLVLPRQKFQELRNQYPDIALSIYRYLANLLAEQAIDFWRAARDVDKMQELVQSTKMAALGHLVAGIAHEINTPVGSIAANSSQLHEFLQEVQDELTRLGQETMMVRPGDLLAETAVSLHYPLTPATRQLVSHYLGAVLDRQGLKGLLQEIGHMADELSEASQRIHNIVRNLANFARLDEADRKTVNIHDGLEATLSLLHHELKYKIDVLREYGALPEITCHPNELNQVFMNILMNAVQAIDPDRLPEGQRGLIRLRTYQEGLWIIIAISDSGKGIQPEHLPRIFEPFFSTKGAAAAAGGLGLGLGLSICQKIVQEKHGGKIEVVSKAGEGTTFYIKLRLDKLSPDPSRQTVVAERPLVASLWPEANLEVEQGEEV